jgi:hypothetical protein
VYDNNFNQMFTVSQGSGGLYYPTALAADVNGYVYAANANGTISKFASNGSPVSPSGGWSLGVTTSFSPSGTGNGYTETGGAFVSPFKIDALGNIWGYVFTSSVSSSCFFKMNSSGQLATPGNFCATAGDTYSIEDAATDGSGNLWALGETTISKANSSGNFVVSAPTSQGCFYPEGNIFSLPNPSQYIDVVTTGILYDHVQNHLWAASETGAGAITDAGAAVFCDLGSTTLPLVAPSSTSSTTPGSAYSAGQLTLANAVLDGAGNLWFASAGEQATGVVGTSSGTFTGTETFANYLSEISASGTLLTPYNASTQTYGLQPAGFGTNGSATVTNGTLDGGGSVELFGVDLYGNIWALDAETYKLLKIMGLASANTVNY